ncbi:MAG: (2Fe-2S) ferredoxin domain-containing protein, partial [Spirochaetaceae bacterium]|nr:(2Fe-2S) ferredoxin domain-containing protein [Spirochaetaceae bacterium]
MAYTHYILVCGGTGCESSSSDEIYKQLQEEAKKQNVAEKVQIVKTGCFGFCEKGPIVKISPDHTFYIKMKPENAERIIKEHIVEGK